MIWVLGLAFCLSGCAAREDAPVGRDLNESQATPSPQISREVTPRFPLRWHIGEIDPRFGISDTEVRAAVEKAANLWEQAAGRQLFQYEEAFGFPVSLVFDERQELLTAAAADERNLATMKRSVAELKRNSEAAARTFRAQSKELDNAIDRYNTRLEDYNRRVAQINSEGGATETMSDLLEAEKVSLAEERGRLRIAEEDREQQRQRLNEVVDRYNTEVTAYNQAVGQYNRRVVGRTAEQIGECTRVGERVQEVKIFAFESKDHLARVLAHELGHALGLGHVDGDGALMSAVEGGAKATHTLKLTSRDEVELKRVLSGNP